MNHTCNEYQVQLVSHQAHTKCTWRAHDEHKGAYFSSDLTVNNSIPHLNFKFDQVWTWLCIE